MLGLGRWGSRAPFPNGHETLGVDAFMLALKTLYDPARADGLIGATHEVVLAGQPFEVRPTEAGSSTSRTGRPRTR